MTLCGWKIFSKNKQRIKRTKNEATTTSASSSSSMAMASNNTPLPSYQSKSTNESSPHMAIKQLPNICESISPDVPRKEVVFLKQKGKSPTTSTPIQQDENDINEKKNKNADDEGDDDGKWEKMGGDTIRKIAEGEDDDGNPRNKCALKPGHSLMDWIRLGSTGCDLSGTKGVIRPISSSELQMHCKKDDAWLAIRGKVYNVTHYMDFHPGGPDELMKGVGKDATKLFDDVHAWVNYEQLLGKCYIGPLKNIVMVDLESSSSTRTHSKKKDGALNIPIPSFTETDSLKISPVKMDSSVSDLSISSSDDIIPRFDWIQKTSNITLIFYTKPFCNPGLIISCSNDNCSDLLVKILIERTTHLYNFKLLNEIEWPSTVKLYSESGKIEINFNKSKRQLWTNYGTMELQKFINAEDQHYDFEVVENTQITHDSYAICLKSRDKLCMVSPIGYHFSVTASVNGNYVTRSYTPVPTNYLPMSCPNTYIPFLIKSYALGILARHITSLSVNTSSSTESENILKLTQPKGNFILKKLLEHCRIGLLAAGSGITPMLSVLDHLLARCSYRIESIQLFLFNKSEEDIWCRQKLESIAVKDERLIIRHILSEPGINWKGETGRITKELISSLSDKKSNDYVTFCCVCGPTPFNELCLELLNDIGFQSSNLHFFQG